MISALIIESESPNPRLIRVPVDQTVSVIRTPAAPTKKFVRSTRIAKSSQTPVAVLDLTHPESEIEPVGKDRYATLCIPHHVVRFHSSISTAEAQSSHPEVWCDTCAQAVRDRDHYRVYGRPGQATA